MTFLYRFDGTERWVHWSTAALIFILIATAVPLYVGSIGAMIGRRNLVREIHVIAGLCLPLPLLLGIASRRWGAALREDLTRINRWTREDRRWLRRWGFDRSVRVEKFNAGQKLNSAFLAGAALVMIATGSIMRWFSPFPDSWRTGATFVHDVVAFLIVIAVLGHIAYALSDPDALKGMFRGWVSGRWARRHAPGWYEEMTESDRGEPDRVGEGEETA